MTATSRPPLPSQGVLARAFASASPGLRRAADAIEREAERAANAEPFMGALLRACAALGRARDASPLLAFWESRLPGNARSDARYRWEINHRRGAPLPVYASDPAGWNWRRGNRTRAARDPFDFETRLILPIVSVENAELLAELAEGDDDQGHPARRLLEQTAPVLRRDFAAHIQMNEPWEDTLALFCLTRRPRTLAMLHPVAIAIGASYAAGCEGLLEGTRYPYAGQPLVSASAQLASSLLTLGSELQLVARLADFVRKVRRDSGGWGDADDPEDPLTTLVAADLLAQVDPSFDLQPTIDYFRRTQADDGLWRALGPEAPWLTFEIVTWGLMTDQPFSARFRWPHRSQFFRDLKTGLPSFAYFIELADLFATMPGLAASQTELAFIDLIGFRAFNNRFGQQAGDDVLRLFGRELEQVPFARAIRDGGDEFLVVAAPCRSSLYRDLDTFRERWPVHFKRQFGADVPAVSPRIIVRRGAGRDLRALREQLGQEITALKEVGSACGDEGLLVQADDSTQQ